MQYHNICNLPSWMVKLKCWQKANVVTFRQRFARVCLKKKIKRWQIVRQICEKFAQIVTFMIENEI